MKWLWKFVDGAKTAGELYGRALVVIAAEQYASRLVVPQSQRSHPSSWASHKDHAAKALKKLAGPHLPGSLRQLETAVKRAHEDATRAERAAAEAQRAGSVGRSRGPGRRRSRRGRGAAERTSRPPTTRTRPSPRRPEATAGAGAVGVSRSRAYRSAGSFPSRWWQPWRAASGRESAPHPAAAPATHGGA